jgi:signal transduction histidine kinase
VAPHELPVLTIDAEKLRQVLINLIENAVKYSPLHARITVVAEEQDGRLRLAVRDEGLGIPLQEQGRIFGKFYRVDPNLTRGVGGTGLGLYICRELVRRMRGRIWLSSEEGVGSTFFVDFPLAAASPSSPGERIKQSA